MINSLKEKLVSVVIPSYNKARFLPQAIESVLGQTHRNYEIIVIDDGSTDETPKVVERYSMVQYFRQRNGGVSAARNAGLRKSKGVYIVFLDADDRLLPNALQTGADCLELHPDCAFVSGHIQIIDTFGNVTSVPQEKCIRENYYRTFLSYNYIWTPAAVMFRASIFEKIQGYSLDRFGAEDWDLYLRIARDFPVFCHDHVVAEYRTDGAMSADPARMLKDSQAALRSQRRFLRGKKDDEEAYAKGIRTAQKYYGDPLVKKVQTHLQNSEWKQVLRGAFVLLIYYPDGFKKAFWRSHQP